MDLREYLQQIDESGELRVIKTDVDTRLELAALSRREFAKHQGGQALLFEQITGSPFPVAANLFGSERRAFQLLHSDSLQHFSEKLQKLLQQKIGTVAERLQFPTNGKDSFLSEETELQFAPDFELTGLPAIQSWPEEGGRYLNLAMALTQHRKLV